MKKSKTYKICEFQNGCGDIWYQVLITEYYLLGLLPISRYQIDTRQSKRAGYYTFHYIACYGTKKEAKDAIKALIREDAYKQDKEDIKLRSCEKYEEK